MSISNDLIKHLRELSGSSISLCKKVLEETGGDIEKAMTLLRKSSEALAAKKSERATKAGLIESYVHSNKRIGVLLELRCETDFVARNPEFQALAHDLALHIAGTGSMYISKESVPKEAKAEAERLFLEEAQQLSKSPEMTQKIVVGKLEAHFRDVSLMSQPFVKDVAITVEELIKSKIAHFGENITVEKFIRFDI